MANSPDQVSMALFCDFENVALGVRDANYDKFDIKRILERLLLKGSIVVKKAYCDWDRYKGFKATMHEANFELIEIPHVRQSGKNSADIRLVVDALDLCYTKSHVNTFVIISGDSDFSPLVSKLRENAKKVIGVGVKQSTSDLLIANCDEFIFYDDLVRESQRALARRQPADAPAAPRRSAEEEHQRKETLDKRRTQAVEIAVETFDALVSERGDSGKIWASVLKEAIKRRKPDFNETYFGFRAFGNLLEEAQARGLLEFGRDEKSGAYVFRSNVATQVQAESEGERSAPAHARPSVVARSEFASEGKEGKEPRRRARAGRKPVQVEVDLEPEFSEAAESAAQDAEPDDQPQARLVRLERALPLRPEVEVKAEFEREPEPEFERPSYFRQQAPRPQPVPPAVPEVQAEAEPAPEPASEKAAAPRRVRAPRKTAAKSVVAATSAEPVAAEASPDSADSSALSEPAALQEPVFAWPAPELAAVPVKVVRPRRARKTSGGEQAG